MNILFDFNHPVDVNFFKNSIKLLAKEQHKIILTYRERGRLKDILQYEIGQYTLTCIGSHRKGFIRKVVGQLYRDYKFYCFQKENSINLSVCFGATNAIASAVNRIPYLAFDDDAEYKIPFYHANLFATRHIIPDFIKVTKKNIFKYRGFKELAYLHPNYFQPDISEIEKYNLRKDKYIFIREVANVSLNYKKENTPIQAIIKYLKKTDYSIVLSLEDKKLIVKFEKDCIILQEPIKDIYSLIKYALFVISSGDTVAREACLLGTPSIYTGGRSMSVNKELIETGCMYKMESYDKIKSQIDALCDNNEKKRIEKLIAEKIADEWDDTTQVILEHIKDFEN